MRRMIAIVAVLAFIGTTTTLEAQARRGRPGGDRGLVELSEKGTRGGFFITGGIGAGREQFKFSGEDDYSESLTSPTLTLRFGGTPSPRVRLGVELFGWSGDGEETSLNVIDPYTDTFGTATGTIQFYPFPSDGLWIKGGAGYARSERNYDDPQLRDAVENGFAWSVGAGYEFPLSRSISIGPSVQLQQGSFSQRNEPTLHERVLNIGVEVTFQTGGRGR